MHKLLSLGVVLAVATIPTRAQAQHREVTGTVRDVISGQPVPDAEVGLVGQEVAVCADRRGEYRLRVPDSTVALAVGAPGSDPSLIRLGPKDTVADARVERRDRSLEGDALRGRTGPGSQVRLVKGPTGRVSPVSPAMECQGGSLVRTGADGSDAPSPRSRLGERLSPEVPSRPGPPDAGWGG